MTKNTFDTITTIPSADSLWDGSHKIPWNDPAFSARILAEHLSQEHHLASRKREIIEAQAGWISSRVLTDGAAAILDLGCGPGLYSELLSGSEHYYVGMDFSPASIDYARKKYGVVGKREFRLGNVTEADFGGPFDLVAMLYGELNVFSPDHCLRILAKAHAALAPKGRLLVERQRSHAVKGVGQAADTWTQAESGGLFADQPYICLTTNHWFEDEGVSLQCFHVQVEGVGEPIVYRSTTKAWTEGEMESLLRKAGFCDVTQHDDWPVQDDSLTLVSGIKA